MDATANLREMRLLLPPSDDEPEALDVHPMVRDFFSQQVQQQQPDAYREANLRLLDHYLSAGVAVPNSITELTPYYAAMVHACRAGEHEQAIVRVFQPFIWQGRRWGEGHKSGEILGAFAADLVALAPCFSRLGHSCTEDWTRPLATLSDETRCFVLWVVSAALKGTGRLNQASESLRVLVAQFRAEGKSLSAVEAELYRADALVHAGDLPGAEASASRCLEALLDRMEQPFAEALARQELGYVRCLRGDLAAAGNLFDQAARLTATSEPVDPHWFAYDMIQAAYRVQFLIEAGHRARARAIAEQSWARYGGHDWLLRSLIRAFGALATGLSASGAREQRQAEREMSEALQEIEDCAQQDYLAQVLVASARLQLHLGEDEAAEGLILRAEEITSQCRLRTAQVDAHLARADLSIRRGHQTLAAENIAAAKKLAQRVGYGLRKPRIRELEAGLASRSKAPPRRKRR